MVSNMSLKPFPITEPYEKGFLQVSDLHRIYYEVSGNAKGIPAVILHGGPGGGSSANDRSYFDPNTYKIIQFDQRGCGKSTPHAELKENTTWHSIEDIEKLRQHLGVESWLVFGGSWGSTLALAYAQSYPEVVRALVLRGIFLLRQKELHWFYQEGASFIFPDAWESYLAPIPKEEQGQMIQAYYKRLTCNDTEIQLDAAKAWSIWEASTVSLYQSQDRIQQFDRSHYALAFARIECHYFINGAFFETDNYLIENLDKIRKIPAVIIQGRYDICTPMLSAWELHRAWSEAEFHIIPDAGHASSEPGIVQQFLAATQKFSSI